MAAKRVRYLKNGVPEIEVNFNDLPWHYRRSVLYLRAFADFQCPIALDVAVGETHIGADMMMAFAVPSEEELVTRKLTSIGPRKEVKIGRGKYVYDGEGTVQYFPAPAK